MTRRTLLRFILYFLFAPTGSMNRRPASAEITSDKGQLLAWLAMLFPSTRKASEIGEAYLVAHPKERDFNKLVEVLQGGSLGRAKSAAEYRDAFELAVRASFEAGELVYVGGWVLSRLEARACALLVVKQGTAGIFEKSEFFQMQRSHLG